MVTNRDIHIEELWRLYRRDRSLEVRNRLVMVYQGFLFSMAIRMAKKLPEYIRIDDMVAYGTFGMIKAVEGYDHRPDGKFLTYAGPKIRGAIIDGMREMGCGKRTTINGRQVYRELPFISMETVTGGEFGDVTIEDLVEDKQTVDLRRVVERIDFWRAVTKGLDPCKQRIIITYLCEGKCQAAIAREIGFNPSRISQLYKEAIGQIKARISREFSRENFCEFLLPG